MSYFLVSMDQQALRMVNQSLSLHPSHRDSMLLKSMILEQLGQKEEAAALKEEAEFLPEGNWSERINLQ